MNGLSTTLDIGRTAWFFPSFFHFFFPICAGVFIPIGDVHIAISAFLRGKEYGVQKGMWRSTFICSSL